ncbi:MAG: hypothetical protein ACXADW_23545 [Candidatus Hodarchaeales archaeon]|jgi:hypothetical protein
MGAEITNDDFFYVAEEEEHSLSDSCEKIMERYVKHIESKCTEDIAVEEMNVIIEINKILKDITIVSIGDSKNGLPATKKHFEAMAKLLRDRLKSNWRNIIVWDDLVKIQRRNT